MTFDGNTQSGRHGGRPSDKMNSNRKHPVHLPPAEQFNTPVIVFVTVCTKNRKPILASAGAYALLLKAWIAADSWLVGRYVVMPDHVHLFCAPAKSDALPLINWVHFWKSYTSQRWQIRKDLPIWQRHFWDRQLRCGESYDNKWTYVMENPIRAGLVMQSRDWPYQGKINDLIW